MPPPPQNQKDRDEAFILGQEEAYAIWLNEKVRRREMSPAEADARMKAYHTLGMVKNWASPARDGREVVMTMREIADEMGGWWSQVYFKKYGKSNFIILKGRAGLRENLKGTRYKLTNAKFASWQVARASIVKGARESARVGVWIVCAADVLDYFLRDKATLGQLFGHLAIDLPAVAIASAAGVAAQIGVVAGATALGITVVASGPLVVGFLVAVGVGYALSKLDEHYQWSERLGAAMDRAFANLERAYAELRRRFNHDVATVIRMIETGRQTINLLVRAERLWEDIQRGWPQVPRWAIHSF